MASSIFEHIPPQITLMCLGYFFATLSMLLYRTTSPQEKMMQLKKTIDALKTNINAQEEPSKADIKALLKHSLQHTQLTLLPSAIAFLPLLWLWPNLDAHFGTEPLVAWGPLWLHTWHLWFFLPAIATTLWLKRRYQIV